MMLQVRIRTEAEEDLADAATWYEGQQAGLGHEFLGRVLTALESIIQQPMMYPAIHKGIRRALMDRFPFGIYYRIEVDSIIVVAVMHGSRNPRRWKERT